MRDSGGYAEAVSDEEVLEGMELLGATEGIFTETAGGVTVAVLKKLVAQGKIGRDERTVAYITGNGLKTLEAAVGRGGPLLTIKPSLSSFEAVSGVS
jgi:threonine synthase